MWSRSRLERLLELGRGRRPARRRRRAGCRAGSGTRRSCRRGFSSLSRIFWASSTLPARRSAPARWSSAMLGVVARLGGGGEGLGGLVPLLQVLEGEPPVEVGEAHVARLVQVLEAASGTGRAAPRPRRGAGGRRASSAPSRGRASRRRRRAGSGTATGRGRAPRGGRPRPRRRTGCGPAARVRRSSSSRPSALSPSAPGKLTNAYERPARHGSAFRNACRGGNKQPIVAKGAPFASLMLGPGCR